MKNYEVFNQALAQWYEVHQRSFPWRESVDPYRIWISEIMSHQTQIERVADKFYPRFMAAFPNLESLAHADWEAEVFPVWDGLGYYRRGRNCLKTAQAIMEKHQGTFPKTTEELVALPGIGQYTAAALMAFAWDEKVPAIDTNISKIIRVLWPEQDTIATAQALVIQSESGRKWNSAMMDLAAHLRRGQPIDGDLAQFFPHEIAQKFIPVKKTKPAKKLKKGEK